MFPFEVCQNFHNTHSIEHIYVNASGFHSSRQEGPALNLQEKVLMTLLLHFATNSCQFWNQRVVW